MSNDSMNFDNIVDHNIDGFHNIEHNCKEKKVKESILLLKRKMCKTHDLIKQYSENMKEIDHLKSNLEVAKKEAKHVISNYKSALDKTRELELKMVEDKQSNENLMNKINKYEIDIAADKQSIQQLTYKIKELEEERSAKIMEYDLEKSSFEDKIKGLEHELKMLKKSDTQNATHKKREKKIISQITSTDVDTTKSNISTKSSSDIGINVSLCDNESSVKRKVQDQSIMTDEFYHTKNDPHPLFCAKCEAHLPPDLTPEKIFKTMTTYPKLIEKDLSPLPKKIYSPPCSSPNIYLGSTNKNEDAFSKISSIPHLDRSYSPYCDSVVDLKSQSGRSSKMTQICENVELRNADISHKPVVANLSTNLNSIPTTLTLTQHRNCVREDFCSDDLLTKHSLSIKEIEKKIRSLKSKMKKFRRLKKKINTSCCCVTNHKDDISLNSNLISIICKGMAEYFNERREACSKNERDVDAETCTCCAKKTEIKRRQQSNKCSACNTCGNIFSKIEKFDEEDQVRDTCCNKTKSVTRATDILQSERTSTHILSSVHKNNSYSNINTPSTSLHDVDESDKEEFVQHEQNIMHYTDHTYSKIIDMNEEENKVKTKAQSIHKDEVDEIYASDNVSSKDNVQAVNTDKTEIKTVLLSNNENFAAKIVEINVDKIKIKSQNVHKDEIGKINTSNILSKDETIEEIIDMDKQIETGTTFLSNNGNSTNRTDGKIVVTNVEKSKIKRKGQNTRKSKVGHRLLKNLRNLKRRRQPISRINKQENIESYSNHDSEYIELAKKPRIEKREEINNCSLNHDRNLKRSLDTQAVSTNKQEDDRLCSNHYESTKKLRIAHIPKTPVPRLSINENDSTHCTIRSIATLATLTTRRKDNINQQLDIHKGDLLIESETREIVRNKKCDEKSIVKSFEANGIDRRSVNNSDLTSAEDRLQNNDIIPSTIDIGHASELGKSDVLNGDTFNRTTSVNEIKKETRNKRQETCVNNEIIETQLINTQNKNMLVNQCDEKSIVKSFEANGIDRRSVNNSDLTSAEDRLQNNDIIPSTINIGHASELGKSDVLNGDTLNRTTSVNEIKNETRNKRQETCVNNEIIETQLINTQNKNMLVNQCDEKSIVKSFEANGIDIRSVNNSDLTSAEDRHQNNDFIPSTIDIGRVSELGKCDVLNEDTLNRTTSVNEIKNRNKRQETCVNNETIETQFIKTQNKNMLVNQRDKEMKLVNVSHYDVEESQAPMSRLIKYINKKKCTKKHGLSLEEIRHVSKITDKFVKKQLQKLMENAWEDSIHDDVKEKLESTCGPRIIAKCIVDFFIQEVDHRADLDKSFTPPAPLMTKFEQKIIALLFDLEVTKPTVIYFVQAAIEYHLFRLNSDVKDQIDSLTRMYVVLSRIQKDREKIRMMCCSALYCMNLKSIGVLYTVLTCWPEVLPNAGANKGVLPKCIASLIGSQYVSDTYNMDRIFKKLIMLKSLLSKFYNYTYVKETTNCIVNELMTALKAERINGLDTAIILVAKREGPSWTYKNIIESILLPMIIKNEHPCIYSAFSLLGRLLRAFPLQDENNIVHNITEQLCDLIQSGQGSHDQQEGIISALLSLSRRKFHVITLPVIGWTPSKPLRPIIDMQLQTFINTRNSKFWNDYLRNKNIQLGQSKA